MSEQHDRDHSAEGNGLSPFEQQLRSIEPTSPQAAWRDIAASLEAQPKVGPSILASPRQVPGWQRIATHAAATLIGVGLGAVLMVMLQSSSTTPAAVTPVDVEPTQPVAARQEKSKLDDPASNQLTNQQQFSRPQRLLPSINGNRTMRSWTFTPLARDIDSRPWERISYEQRPVVDEESSASPLPDSTDKPMSAPELLRQMLKDQAQWRPWRGIELETKKVTHG